MGRSARQWLCAEGIDGRGRIVALWPLNPTWVTVLHVPDSWELFYRVSYPHGGTITYPAEAILHLRGMTLDGWTGVSPVTYHRETIGLAIAAQQYGAAFFGNSAQPQGGLKVPHVLDKTAGDVLRASWEQNFKGAKNAKQARDLRRRDGLGPDRHGQHGRAIS
jgi:HK97 family phage portal protein